MRSRFFLTVKIKDSLSQRNIDAISVSVYQCRGMLSVDQYNLTNGVKDMAKDITLKLNPMNIESIRMGLKNAINDREYYLENGSPSFEKEDTAAEIAELSATLRTVEAQYNEQTKVHT